MSNTDHLRLSGLYAITPDALSEDPRALHEAVIAAAEGGAVLVQYRNKRWHQQSAAEQQSTIARLRALGKECRARGCRLIINDLPLLAMACEADGVHLGQRDGAISEARALLGTQAIIGISCGPLIERAHAAVTAGADYVAFGRFYPSRTKPDAPQAEITVLHQAKADLHLPICAIGGITPYNGTRLITAGADLLAAVEGVFVSTDPSEIKAAAQAFTKLFV